MHLFKLPQRPVAPFLVLGTDDVASAVGHALHIAGLPVVMVRDHSVPVLRRRMALDDAVEYGTATLEGVRACIAENPLDLSNPPAWRLNAIQVTTMPLDEALCLGGFAALVDARMQRRSSKIDLRRFAPLTIGLGPGYDAGHNVHVAIETAPEASGQILYAGATLPAHGRSAPIGGVGHERFGRSTAEGTWITPRRIGDPVGSRELIGFVNSTPVFTPLAGRLRGLVRDGVSVAAGAKLIEVDPRQGAAQCRGIPPRAGQIAAVVRSVVEQHVFAGQGAADRL